MNFLLVYSIIVITEYIYTIIYVISKQNSFVIYNLHNIIHSIISFLNSLTLHMHYVHYLIQISHGFTNVFFSFHFFHFPLNAKRS